MTTEHFASHLLAALSAALGQPIELDSDGDCVLEFEGDVEIAISLREDWEAVALRSPLVSLEPETSAERLSDALSLNYAGLPPGHAVALDPSGQHLALMVLLSAATTPQEEFLAVLSGMVQIVPMVREALGSNNDGAV